MSVTQMALPPRQTGRAKSVRTFALVASLVALLLLSSLYVPFITRAIASIPGIGQVYQRMLIWSGLNIAHDSGLVKEFQKSIEVPNGTLTVFASYSDSTKTVVMFEVKAHNGDAESFHRELRFYVSGGPKWVKIGPGAHSSWGGALSLGYDYNEQRDTFYVWLETDPLPWWWFKGISLNVQQHGVADFHAKTSVPSTRVTAFNQQTVRVNRWYDEQGNNVPQQDPFNFTGLYLHVDKVQFTPSTTKLIYDAIGGSPHRWKMITEDGTVYSTYGDSFSASFPHTRSKELSFVLMSYMSYNGHMSLPLERGSIGVGSDNMGGNNVRVEIVDILHEENTEVSLAIDAGDRRIASRASLLDDEGKSIFIKTGSRVGEGTVTFIFTQLEKDRVYKLNLTLDQEIDCNISFTVRR